MTERDDYLWNPGATPDPAIRRLEEALRPLAFRPGPAPARRARRWRAAVGLAAALSGTVVGWTASRAALPWEVRAMDGTPTLGRLPLQDGARMRTGAWLVTDDRSSARVRVGRIGTAEIGPNSRLRLVRARGTEHRMSLERGTLQARIWAPPRFFLVETPAALAVDLGCVYSLRVSADGGGLLSVSSGEVELVGAGRRSLVPAGNAARMHVGAGPGSPFPDGSSASFRAALDSLDFGNFRPGPLDTVLREATGRATVTLWHLIPRVPAPERGRVFDRLAALSPPPHGVTRERVTSLDAAALQQWRDSLEAGWSTERVSSWKRLWRRAWARVHTG